jgi:molecular chaperone DnaK (HSP70)
MAQEFIVAIDFGTTYSGVAYIHNNGNLGDDIESIAERIKVIRSWPNNGSNDKTKTVLHYNTTNNKPLWGGQVEPHNDPQITRFKLGLEESVSNHYQSSEVVPQAASRIAIFRRPRQYRAKEPVDFAADYLSCLYKYMHEKFFPREFGGQGVQNQQISYVITVPAIWSDAAKALTRTAATRASIPNARLTLVTEPEAAALYCGTACEADLLPGDRFLICDAGGGTVVFMIRKAADFLRISFPIKSLQHIPNSLLKNVTGEPEVHGAHFGLMKNSKPSFESKWIVMRLY